MIKLGKTEKKEIKYPSSATQ